MTGVDEIRELFSYNRTVLEKYLRSLERLPEAIVSRDRGVGHGSMRRTFLHILAVHDAWINYVLPGRLRELARRKDPRGIRSRPKIREYFNQVWTGIDAFLAGLSNRDLLRSARAPWMPGRYSVRDALFQTTFEQAHHLGELIALYWQMDRPPPEMVWIVTIGKLRQRRGRAP